MVHIFLPHNLKSYKCRATLSDEVVPVMPSMAIIHNSTSVTRNCNDPRVLFTKVQLQQGTNMQRRSLPTLAYLSTKIVGLT